MVLSLLSMNSLGLRVKHKFMVACTATFLIILLQNELVHTVLCHSNYSPKSCWISLSLSSLITQDLVFVE